MRKFLSRFIAPFLALALVAVPASAQDVTVFAAASLKNALDDAAGQWTAETGKKAVISYAASSALAKQITEGAPADIFISADLAWMDHVEKAGLVADGTRKSLLGNSIVLIAPKDSKVSVKLVPGVDLAAALGADGKLAMADVAAVPAGKYGKAALEKLGAWAGVEGKVAQAENVRAALALVSRGEAPLGIVYKTDAAADSSVKIVDTFPKDSHPEIVYPVAQIKTSKSPDAAAFLNYLRSPKAVAAFEKQGFTLLD
ncbi:molybdate ABC transporter substrate-binding protein [Terrihabitans soli]|uniref:Molybdate ABC transporter substrate-binding protein n=1 Tax=Terrihabitans soli TaxID=708113 RepID=A0A6S6QKJ6_9HYPH|nr:molybdate ABC transporter substrate-binding protein [Terrihabitans soli]BCJ89786.1 molybdate ABC transporter substrate-binding protein [Terrihabitans soli]